MAESVRILILEDNPVDAELVQYELQEAGFAFTARVVKTEKAYRYELEEFSPDVILSDYDLPQYSGALALLEARKRCPAVPFILVTGAISEERAIDTLTNGAKDYVMKNRLQQRLVPAIKRAVAEAEEQRAREKAEEELREAYRTMEERVKIRTAELEAEMMNRRKVEDALRESEQRYRTVADFTYDWEFWISPEGRFNYVSPSVERITGRQVSPNARVDDLYRQIVHPEDLENCLVHLRKMMTGHGPGETEFRIKRSDGTVRWIHHVCQPIYNAEGRFLGTRGSNRDITERKRADEDLRDAQQRLAVIVDSIVDGFYALDREWRFTHVNDAALRHMGKTSEGILGRRLFDVFPEARGSVIENEYHHAMERGEPRHFENPSLVTDRILEIHAYPGRDILTVLFCDITDRNQTATALRESEATLRGILNASKESIWLFSPDGVVITANETALLRFGKSADDVIGKHFHEVLDAQLAKSRLAHLREVVQSGQPVEFEDERSGFIFRHSFYPITDADGHVKSVTSFSRDITEHKKAEKALRESAARSRLLSTTAGRLLGADDPQAIVEDLCRDVMAHLDCQAFLNFLVDERAGKLHLNASGGIPEEYARAIEWLDYGVTVCGRVARERCRMIVEDISHTRDKQTYFLRFYGIEAYCCYPLMYQDRLIGTLSFGTKTRPHFTPDEVELMRMVSDQVAVAIQRKQTEQDLQDAKDYLEHRVEERTRELQSASFYTRRLIETNLDPLVMISADGKIMDVNVATEHATGLSRSELLGSDFSNYFTEPEKARAGYEKVFQKGSVRDYHLAIRHCSGRVTEVLYNASTYLDEEGNIQGIFAAARDVTELRRAQRELWKSYEELERHVQERTADLKERTTQLEASNKELESFSYSVSHDLKAPLRAIDGFSRALLKRYGNRLDDDANRRLNVICSNAQKMGQLINDLLSFSRLSSHPMRLTQIDMQAMVLDMWKEIEAEHPDRRMEITVGDMQTGYGDPSLVRQVLVNLLSNAAKFTKERTPTVIEVSSSSKDDEVVYCVRDNGAGFDMNYYDRLFGVFQRLHSADEYEGTGIGLAIVQRIIHRHGGRVWAEGKEGRGAAFFFTLPAECRIHRPIPAD